MANWRYTHGLHDLGRSGWARVQVFGAMQRYRRAHAH
jgi:hypothetical protein